MSDKKNNKGKRINRAAELSRLVADVIENNPPDIRMVPPCLIVFTYMYTVADGKYGTTISGSSEKLRKKIYEPILRQMQMLGYRPNSAILAPLKPNDNPINQYKDYQLISTVKNHHLQSQKNMHKIMMAVRRMLEFRMSLHAILAQEQLEDSDLNNLRFIFLIEDLMRNSN